MTTIALPDRSEVEELSSDYAQSILDKVIIITNLIIIIIIFVISMIMIIIIIIMIIRLAQWLVDHSRTSFNLPPLKLPTW